MTYQEAVEKMEAMPELMYRTVEFETGWHTDRTVRVCKLYTETHGGVIIQAASWNQAFSMLADRITAESERGKPAAEDQAPTEDVIPAPTEVHPDDVPF